MDQYIKKIAKIAKVTTITGIILALAPACSTSKKKDASIEAEGGAQGGPIRPTAITREMAHLRAKQISHPTYNLWFGLDDIHEDYEGRAVIQFEFKSKGQELSKKLLIDFEEGTVRSLNLNGQPLNVAEIFDGHHITLNTAGLTVGHNRVEIAFTHPFSKNGAGLHRFKDPVDGRVYLYSDFEPYDAHRMFPCFDQPDLKASFELTAETPDAWQVISSTPERDVTSVDGRKSWQFPPSPVFSTYVFSLHAGPYASWKANANGIPIRLFARQSIKRYVDHQEWLEVTKQGLEWYGNYFGYAYPYAKYDQVIVPDFNSGAMENVGAVTFNERYVHRSKVTQDTRRGRANTILHEMAHMWFGDLVTMRWWNGLWLNESFATFMAAKAVDSATRFKGSWQDFFNDEKEWGYWEDQLVTTHPIEVPVFDTDQATTNFDGITYGKGAAVLKQLNFLLGDDDFREGLQRYFQKYAMRNTTVNDFIRMLSEASSKDLGAWQRSWLQSSGVNTIRADWACEASPDGKSSKISRFSLKQSAPELAEASKEIRPHRMQVGLFKLKGSPASARLVLSGTPQTVLVLGAETQVSALVGAACPDLVYPNYQDHDYAKTELDPVSLNTAQTKLARSDDPFLRQMLWHSLWEMVADGKLKAQSYADTVLSQGTSEKDTQVLSTVLGSLVDRQAGHSSVAKFLAGKARETLIRKVENVTRNHLGRAAAGSDVQLIWFKAFLESMETADAQGYARRLFLGKVKLPGLAIDQERRWEILRALARSGFEEAPAMISAELQADNTDMGQKQAIRASVGIPLASTKAEWLDKIMNRKEPFPKLREAMRNYHVLGQEALDGPAVDPYFTSLPTLPSLGDEEYLRRFASTMYPSLCDTSVVRKTTELLASNPSMPVLITKPLRVGRQEEERCIRARALSATSPL
jgi:aminopeptidase N